MKQLVLGTAFLGTLLMATPCFAQSTPVEKKLAEGGPFVSTGNTIQNFSAPITVDTKDVAPLTFTFINGPEGASKFAWVRVFLSNENSSTAGKNGTPNGVMILTEKNLKDGKLEADWTGRLRGGKNTIYVTGAGFKGAAVSWKLTTVLSSLKLTSAQPTVSQPGGTVTLTGVGFGATPAANTVYFDRSKAKVTSASATSMQVTVPAELKAGSYPLQINVGNNKSNALTVTIAEPAEITSCDWKAGPALQVVTITGKGFSKNAADNVVSFGGTKSPVTSSTDTTLTTTVPYFPELNGAMSYLAPTNMPITVTVNGVAAKGSLPFLSAVKGWQ